MLFVEIVQKNKPALIYRKVVIKGGKDRIQFA